MPRLITSRDALLPHQVPSFFARHSTNGNDQITINTDVVFGTVTHNNGGHYDSSNGRFTVPFDGVYFFAALLLSNQSNRLFFHLRKNGTRINGTSVETLSQTSNYASGQTHATLTLDAGDYITVHATTAAYGGIYDHFTGHLVR